jgi:hypothetical protein
MLVTVFSAICAAVFSPRPFLHKNPGIAAYAFSGAQSGSYLGQTYIAEFGVTKCSFPTVEAVKRKAQLT